MEYSQLLELTGNETDFIKDSLVNTKQKMVLWVGIVVVIVMGLIPPWCGFHTAFAGFDNPPLFFPSPTAVGYDWIWSKGNQVDVIRLAIQWFMAAVLTAGLFFTFKKYGKTRI